MRKFFTAILFILLAGMVRAQNVSSYLADLDRLYLILKKTPSFKDQVKGNKLQEYNHLLDHLKKDTSGVLTDYDIFYRLTQLFFPFKDNHLGFYQFPSSVLDRSQYNNADAVGRYKNSKAFQQYPKFNGNTDSLELVLKKKPKDSVEGIYYYGSYLAIGLYKKGNAAEYTGVILQTALPNWERGQIAIRLFENAPGQFRAVYGHPVSKGLMLYGNEKFRNHSLVNSYFYSSFTESVYRKDTAEIDFVNIKRTEEDFQFKNLTPAMQYIRIGNFSAMNSDRKISQEFYDRFKDSLTAPNLIVDLRNNSGGAKKVSRNFYKLIRSFSKKGKVYVLINNGTMSEGERFVLQLKKLSNVEILGQQTMGTIAYGSNYGKTEKLPSGRFQIYITDMKDRGNYLKYESIGIAPDSILQNNQDWIEQVVRKIENK